LADFIGVSKASVSKWENGQTYPDITLLPLLASYFDITVDQLLSYSNNLSTEQIRKIYQSLANSFKDNSPEEVYKSFEEIVHRYYSCAPLILEMGQFLVNHGDLFPGGNDKKDKAEKYLTEAQDFFNVFLKYLMIQNCWQRLKTSRHIAHWFYKSQMKFCTN
jgi:Predicted transcriptional regulators